MIRFAKDHFVENFDEYKNKGNFEWFLTEKWPWFSRD